MRRSSPRGPYKMPISHKELFWRKVDKSGDCWIWTASRKGGRNKKYGAFHTRENCKCKTWYAHRYSYFINKGPIPNDLVVTHACDNGLCVNPDHLIASTQAQNVLEASERKLLKPYDRRGEGNHRATITEHQAKQIKQMIEEGSATSEIVRVLGVKRERVYDIKGGYAWTHI